MVMRVFGLKSSIFCKRSMASSGDAEYFRPRFSAEIGEIPGRITSNPMSKLSDQAQE